jgi:hypothetical protein
LIEVGDVITMTWPEKGINDTTLWSVAKVGQTWDNGLTTSLTVRRIIP